MGRIKLGVPDIFEKFLQYLASEAINLLDHKTFGGNMAIKLDIKKTFDIIDWVFLLNTLNAFGFNCNDPIFYP
ncbi:hypothetical protein Lal_00014352 [Lupinus albus]|nr:hypothetical protein Lal_00014352 [Lupinus albus]